MPDDKLKSNLSVSGRHIAAILSGVIISRLLKANVLDSELAATIAGFLPVVIYNVWMAIKARVELWGHIKLALTLPQDSTVDDLKDAIKKG